MYIIIWSLINAFKKVKTTVKWEGASAVIAKYKILLPPVYNITEVSLFSKNKYIVSYYCPSWKLEYSNTCFSI